MGLLCPSFLQKNLLRISSSSQQSDIRCLINLKKHSRFKKSETPRSCSESGKRAKPQLLLAASARLSWLNRVFLTEKQQPQRGGLLPSLGNGIPKFPSMH